MKRVLLFVTVLTSFCQYSAQVTYFDYSPDVELHATYAGESIQIDFDNDLNPELTLYGTKHDTTFSGFPVTLTGFAMTTYGNTEIVGRTTTVGTETVLEADTLLPGAVIDGSSNYINSSTPSVFPGVGLNADASGFAAVGQFAGAEEKYIGVKFDISGATHYGWIRVSVVSTHDTCMIYSYGYETAANTAIDAGDTGAGTASVEEESFDGAISFEDGQFKLTQLSGANLTVYNILGEVEMSCRISSDKASIEAGNLSSGVYLAMCFKGVHSRTYKVYVP